MTMNGQAKVIEEMKSLWIQMAQKADQLGVDLFLNIIQHTDGGCHWMMYGDTDVYIDNGEMTTRRVYTEYRVEEETTSLPAASEK